MHRWYPNPNTPLNSAYTTTCNNSTTQTDLMLKTKYLTNVETTWISILSTKPQEHRYAILKIKIFKAKTYKWDCMAYKPRSQEPNSVLKPPMR